MSGVVVNGVSNGLGRALFEQLLTGTNHAVLGLTTKLSDEITALAATHNEPATRYVAVAALDQRFPEKVEAALPQPLFPDTRYNRIVFVNNAGSVAPVEACENFTPQEIIDHININYTSPAIIINQLAKFTAERQMDLHIITLSSEAVKMTIQGWSLYCSSKTAIERYSQCVSSHSNNRTITAETVDPGPLDTGMQRYLRENTAKAFVTREYYVKMADSGKLRQPADAARDILKAAQLVSPY